MKAVLIYRHPDCAKCARIARTHKAFDWLGRIDDTTATPRSGPLRLGQVVVEDRRTGRLYEGAPAFDLICRQIPLYAPFRPLLRIGGVRRLVERQMGGCTDDACEIPGQPSTRDEQHDGPL